MQIQIKAGRLQMGAEALEEISRALKRETEEILSARRTLERQSVFSHELRQLRSIEASIEEDERRLERLSYGLTRIDSLYQQAERSALERFEAGWFLNTPAEAKELELSGFIHRSAAVLFRR